MAKSTFRVPKPHCSQLFQLYVKTERTDTSNIRSDNFLALSDIESQVKVLHSLRILTGEGKM